VLLIAFLILTFVVLVSAFLVIAARNPVHSVLWLICTFFTAAGLLVLIGAEFLAMLLVVVYVGAVAVLFLFVVMMLDVDFVELKQGFLNYLPVGALVALALLAEIGVIAWATMASGGESFDPHPTVTSNGRPLDAETNAEALAAVLYTEYLLLFQLAGLVLLIAMMGAIVLTLRQRASVKRQDIAAQTGRRREDAVELIDVRPGQGI
jgi:NADH-quinone oxidoreductase subunit J